MMSQVRTTITLDPDVALLVQRAMRERGLSFKEAVNEALRRGLGGESAREPFRQRTVAMGEPRVDVTKALELAGRLEVEEIARKLQLRK